MTDGTEDVVRGDRALRSGEPDLLGFGDVAARIATALADHGVEGSLVIGLEGKWGSGKSSLLGMVEERVAASSVARPCTVVAFKPWLVGSRDALLGTLFGEMSSAIDRIQAEQGDATRETLARTNRAMDAFRNFAEGLGKAGTLVETVGTASALPPLTLLGKGMKAVGLASKRGAGPSLATLKAKLVDALRDLDRRIVIMIDDLDRLEPTEVVEVLRLVRSVADFPNVVYLLCYDSEVLARSIERAAGVDDGDAYLEKIVQLTVMVPHPEAFQLRHWFSDELSRFAAVDDEQILDRLRSVVDTEGGQRLTTPRAVNRALDALRLLWPPLRDEGADLADLVWLQLVKNGDPRLYRWIEEYCATAAELSLGAASVSDEERAAQLRRLLEIAGPNRFDSLLHRQAFADQLPGMTADYGKDEPAFRLFGRISDLEHERAIVAKRLSSPDHYRLYFALSDPSHALKRSDFEAFWAAADAGPAEVATVLLDLHRQPTSRPLGKADLLIERIRNAPSDRLSPLRAANVLVGFAETMDEALRTREFNRFWITSLWDRAERLSRTLVARLDADLRLATVDRMFATGAALGWLTTLFRRETHAHGRFGDETKRQEDWMLDDGELDRITATMIARYRRLGIDGILGGISPRDVLFAWSQGGGETEVKELLAAASASDDRFLDILAAIRSLIGTTEGTFRILKKSNVSGLLGFDEARSRVEALSATASDPSVRARAVGLRRSFERGDEY